MNKNKKQKATEFKYTMIFSDTNGSSIVVPNNGPSYLQRIQNPGIPDNNTGVKHDTEKAPLAYIPEAALIAEGEAFKFGAKKYASWNYKNGLAVTRTLSAALRHIYKFLSEEDIDPESGVHHLGCARANLGMALDTLSNHPEFDDRFKRSKS